MKTKEKIGGLLVAALLTVSLAHAGSSVNGAPGRSDFNKRKDTQAWKSMKARPLVPAPTEREPVKEDALKAAETSATPPVARQQESIATSRDNPSVEPLAIVEASTADDVPVKPAAVPKIVEKLESKSPLPAPAAVTVMVAAIGEAKKPALTISYADVLTDRQKVVLKGRAEDLKFAEDDYDNLLSPDEKERLDALVRERTAAMVAGE